MLWQAPYKEAGRHRESQTKERYGGRELKGRRVKTKRECVCVLVCVTANALCYRLRNIAKY